MQQGELNWWTVTHPRGESDPGNQSLGYRTVREREYQVTDNPTEYKVWERSWSPSFRTKDARLTVGKIVKPESAGRPAGRSSSSTGQPVENEIDW